MPFSIPPLKLGHLRLIAAIAEHGQVSLAADALSITQPAASRMLAEAERMLGTKICERRPRGIELTEIGRAIARRAHNVLIEMRDLSRDINELSSGQGGVVKVGAVTGGAIGYVVPAVQQLKSASPGAEIHISIGTSDILVRDLMAGSLDLVLARIPALVDPGLFETHRAEKETIDLIVRKDHPLSTARSVSLAGLTNYEWIIQPSGTPMRRAVETAFLDHDLPFPKGIVNSTSLLVTIAILSSSTAVAPIARELSQLLIDEKVDANVRVLPLKETIEIEPYLLLTVRGRHLSPTANRLKQLLLAELRTEKRSTKKTRPPRSTARRR